MKKLIARKSPVSETYPKKFLQRCSVSKKSATTRKHRTATLRNKMISRYTAKMLNNN